MTEKIGIMFRSAEDYEIEIILYFLKKLKKNSKNKVFKVKNKSREVQRKKLDEFVKKELCFNNRHFLSEISEDSTYDFCAEGNLYISDINFYDVFIESDVPYSKVYKYKEFLKSLMKEYIEIYTFGKEY